MNTAPLPATPHAVSSRAGLALSVVMPASGRAHLVAETLRSLAAQTRRDWELIVPDDSPDETQRATIKAHVEAFARDTGIPTTYLFTAPRLLQSRNTNQGLALAQGRWVRILHSDDLVAPWGLEAELTIVERFSATIEALFVDPVAFRDTFEPCADFRTTLLAPRYIVRTMLHSGTALPSCTIFRRELLERIGPFDPGYDFLCDWKFFYRLLIDQIRRGRTVARVSPAWIGWRLHGDSVTGRLWATHYLEHLRLMAEIRDSRVLAEVTAFTEDEQADFFRRGLFYRQRRLFDDCRRLEDAISPDRLRQIEDLLVADPAMLEAQAEIVKLPPAETDLPGFHAAWSAAVTRANARQIQASPPPPPPQDGQASAPAQAPAQTVDAVTALIEAGNLASSSRDLAGAAEHYLRAIDLDPLSADAHGGLGYVLLEKGQTENAASSLQRSLELCSTNAGVHFNLGNALLRLGKPEEALLAYQAASSLDPDCTHYLQGLGYCLLELDRATDALPILQRAANAAPDSSNTLADLARALARLGDHAAGVEKLRTACALAPERADLRLALARALVACGRNSEAVAVCEELLAREPGHAEAAALRDEATPFSGHYERWRETRFDYILSRFGADAFRARTLLELGAGLGILGSRFQALGAHVTCAEARADHVAAGAARFPAQRFVCQNLEEDFRHLGSFDFVLHTGLLYHLHQVDDHLRRLRDITGEWLILETEVADSSDPQFILEINEQKEAYDQSFVGVGTRPSAAYIERILRESGFQVERCDDARINAGFHRYDWPVTDADSWKFGRWEHGLRRFWLCRKLPSPADVS